MPANRLEIIEDEITARLRWLRALGSLLVDNTTDTALASIGAPQSSSWLRHDLQHAQQLLTHDQAV